MRIVLNPFTAPACKISGLQNAHGIYSVPITHLLSVLCVLMKVLSRSHASAKEKTERLQMSHFYRSFSSDITAVIGLNKS